MRCEEPGTLNDNGSTAQSSAAKLIESAFEML